MAESITAPVAAPAPAATPTPAPAASAPIAVAAPAKPLEAAKPPTPSEIRKLKLKIDGKEEEIDENEAAVLAQKGRASERRFQEAAAVRKEAQDVIAWLKQNPAEAMKKLGVDPRKFSEEFLVDALQREAESPAQKEVRENREKLAAYEKKDKEREASEKKAQEAKIAEDKRQVDGKRQREIMERFDVAFTAALDKSGLPKNAYTIKRMAELQRANLRAKGEFTPDQLAKIVAEDYNTETKHRTSGLEGEKLLEFIASVDPTLLKRVQKGLIGRLKGKHTFSAPTTPTPPPAAESGSIHQNWRAMQKARRKLQAPQD